MGRLRHQTNSDIQSPSAEERQKKLWILLAVLLGLNIGCVLLVVAGGREEANAMSWRDVIFRVDLEPSLRGSDESSSKSNNQHNSNPGEHKYEIKEDPFHSPPPSDSVHNNDNEETDNETDDEDRIEPPASDAPTPSSTTTTSSAYTSFYTTSGTSEAKGVSPEHPIYPSSNPDNVFSHQSSTSSASVRDIRPYRTSRVFVPPTESPASAVSTYFATTSATAPTPLPLEEYPVPTQLPTEENLPTSSPTTEDDRYAYPENSLAPPQNPPKGYFNYDSSGDSWYGPGYPVFSGGLGNGNLAVEYANNAWVDYRPPAAIPPKEAMAIANGIPSDASFSDYFYWDEFGPDGFGPWKNTLRNLRQEPNQCGSVGRQSPIDIQPNGAACLEHHQIRSRRGDFRVFGRRNNLDMSILPSKLRVGIQRRPCRQIENPVCSEPDPPHADFPHGWPGFVDVIHVDFKLPAEHRVYGKAFDGEMQIYHLHPGRKRLPVVSVLMEVVEGEDGGDEGHNEYLQEAIDGFQYEYDSNKAKCAKTAIDIENRRLQMKNRSRGESESEKERCDGTKKQSTAAAGESSFDAGEKEDKGISLQDCHKDGGSNDSDVHAIEVLANTTFGGDRERMEEYARFMEYNSSFSMRKDNHRRRLKGIWNPHHESLVPSIYFYGYDGSLTEPPCSEIVSWFVIDEPMKISRNQLEQMKYLLFTNVDGTTCQSTSVHHQSSVARPIQDTGAKRQIWHCTVNDYLPD